MCRVQIFKYVIVFNGYIEYTVFFLVKYQLLYINWSYVSYRYIIHIVFLVAPKSKGVSYYSPDEENIPLVTHCKLYRPSH